MAGVVVKGRFPRRRLVLIVATNIFRYLFQGAARSWARNLGATAPALGSMTLLLVMSGFVGLTAFALNNLERSEASQASMLHIYLRDEAAPSDVIALMNRLQADPRIATVTYTSKEDALARAQRIPGLPELADSTESNPFPASLDVQVKNINDVAGIDAWARTESVVDPVYPTSYDRGAYQRIQAVLFGIAVAGFIFLSLLGFVAITVTMNGIKAAIHARRDEIAIMQLVGASRWMVRGPFVIEGAITGGVAGLVAGLITFGSTSAAISSQRASFTQFAPGVTLTVGGIGAGVVLLLGIALGSGSSLISLRRHFES